MVNETNRVLISQENFSLFKDALASREVDKTKTITLFIITPEMPRGCKYTFLPKFDTFYGGPLDYYSRTVSSAQYTIDQFGWVVIDHEPVEDIKNIMNDGLWSIRAELVRAYL
ncbi:hypothetical protein H4219_003658 [Mycoemilia scoparia]|uniref:Uncharacterized protein n=1 Tax=Mycoemilia scoparia TaxID=417184 RepID=A0A9W7ZU39_9FUNG|nr:hypothetical protein H4219_003658 [Mycoemilia scoparia]